MLRLSEIQLIVDLRASLSAAAPSTQGSRAPSWLPPAPPMQARPALHANGSPPRARTRSDPPPPSKRPPSLLSPDWLPQPTPPAVPVAGRSHHAQSTSPERTYSTAPPI